MTHLVALSINGLGRRAVRHPRPLVVSRRSARGVLIRGRLSPEMLTHPAHMKTLVGRSMRCAKCGVLLAATRTKKRTNGSFHTQSYRGVRMEYGRGKELGWVLCVCGHETPLGRSKTRSSRLETEPGERVSRRKVNARRRH